MPILTHDDVMGFIKAIDGIANHLTNRANIDVQGWYVPKANGIEVYQTEDAEYFEIEWVIRRLSGPNSGTILEYVVINFEPVDIFDMGYRDMVGNARNIARVAFNEEI